MRILPRSRSQRWQVKPPELRINWGHPLANRLTRAYLFTGYDQTVTPMGSEIYDLCGRSVVQCLGVIRDHLPGPVLYVNGSQGGSEAAADDLTPGTGQGSGGLTLAAGCLFGSQVANAIADKYQTALEYVFGCTATLLLGWMYDNTVGAYIGRSAPYPSLNVFHNLALVWNGAAAESGVAIWQDGLQVDNASFSAGVFSQVRLTSSTFGFARSNGGTGTSSDLYMNYLYLFMRGLLPDEIGWLNDDPYAFLVQPRRQTQSPSIAAAAAWDPSMFPQQPPPLRGVRRYIPVG